MRLFGTGRRLPAYLLLLSGGCYLAAGIFYRRGEAALPLPAHWHSQFYGLLLFSALLSLLPVLTQRALLRTGGLALKLIALLLMSYPLGGDAAVPILLATPFLTDALVLLPLPLGLGSGGAAVLLLTFSQGGALLWEGTRAPMAPEDRMLLLFWGGLLLLLCGAFRKLSEEHRAQGRELGRLDEAMKRLSRVNLDFQSYAQRVERESTEQERKRIARELHDIIGYTLTNQLMIIQAVMSLKDRHSPRLDTLLEQAHKQLGLGIADARSALHQLHRSEEKREEGSALLVRLTKTFGEITGLRVELELANLPPSLGPRRDDALYRLVQEGMTNAFRHGRATEIRIIFWKDPERVRVSVWDNGNGGASLKEGLGIRGMRERFAALGGEIKTTGGPEGFTLKAWLPLEGETPRD